MNLRLILALGASALAAACTTVDPYTGETVRDNRATGAILGALAGAGLGYATNTSKSEEGRTNALIGAGVGALAGGSVGHYMDRQQAQLREQLRGSGVEVIRQGDNIVLDVPGDITFAYDRADIRPEMRAPLERIAATLREYPATLVDVVGHADSRGSDEYNQGLSERRANSVATYLMDRGVMRERMYVAGRGESQPKASNETDAGRAQNRRVEIILRPHTGRG